ncbi:MAG: alpha/beta hydrolase, partial [Pannonibacter sp.]
RQAMLEAGRASLDVTYGEGERNKLDLFLPAGEPRGLVVFVHGGFWLRLDRSYWSHFARGSIEAGFAVAMPSYTLCPDIRISGITAEVGAAIEKAAEMVEGSIRLIGHSAGGNLVTRMVTTTSPLPQEVQARVVHTVSLSGVHDLRPLMQTAMNAQLNIDQLEAWRESPALLEPMPGARLTCWVGATERSEFLRQNALLSNLWKGLGAETEAVEEPDRHHFNILDGLADPHHPLTKTLLS